jgi:hypothetical protein
MAKVRCDSCGNALAQGIFARYWTKCPSNLHTRKMVNKKETFFFCNTDCQQRWAAQSQPSWQQHNRGE